jgi:hypothetical protein
MRFSSFFVFLFCVFGAVAFPVELKDRGMVDDPINGRRCRHGILEDLVPFAEDQIRGDHQAPALGAVGRSNLFAPAARRAFSVASAESPAFTSGKCELHPTRSVQLSKDIISLIICSFSCPTLRAQRSAILALMPRPRISISNK